MERRKLCSVKPCLPHHCRHTSERRTTLGLIPILLLVSLTFNSHEQCTALMHQATNLIRHERSFKLSSLPSYQRRTTIGRQRRQSRLSSIGYQRNYHRKRSSLNMVLTTPASIIEQASTKVLLDYLIDESTRTSARNPVMMQFNPSSGALWRRWSGTVFSETWSSCVKNMLYAAGLSILYKLNEQVFSSNLAGFNILWGQLLSVTTFTLTFFLNQSYALWRKCYELSRRLQGRLNDLNMTIAVYAKRKGPRRGESEDEQFSTYTEPARQILELMARYTRVFNILTYASFTGSHRPILTPQGMRRLVDRGIITENERTILSDSQLPINMRHNALLMWIIRLFVDARSAGHIGGGQGFEQQWLEKCHVIRAQYGAIGDELQGRMPLAYAHIVQVLVDVILWMYPLMALSTGMTPWLGIVGTGLLTMFYQGLFNLAKQFLDPYDNESYGKGEDPLCIDTLIAETNSGSVRWMNGLAQHPVAYDHLKNGDMLDYQLPMRGWTIDEMKERDEMKRQEADIQDLLINSPAIEDTIEEGDFDNEDVSGNREENTEMQSLLEVPSPDDSQQDQLQTLIASSSDGGEDGDGEDAPTKIEEDYTNGMIDNEEELESKGDEIAELIKEATEPKLENEITMINDSLEESEDECSLQEEEQLTMEEALAQLDNCSEKVP